MTFFREVGQCIKYLCRKSRQKDITFYVEHAGYFPYFEGMLLDLLRTGDVSIAYITSAEDDPILAAPQGMSVFYVHKLLPYLFLFMNTRVCVMTMPDFDRFHIKKSIRSVGQYVYVFHSLISTHMQYRKGAFDFYTTILCAGPHHVREIREREIKNGLQSKKLIEAGYYRLERVYEAYHRAPRARNKDAKICVLLAPSWGKDNILESCGDTVVRILLAAGYEVIVRPHPEVVRRSPDLLSRLKEKFSQFPDFALEMSVRTDDSLLHADILVTDWSGIAFEYALGTERPVLFVDVPKKVHNPAYTELGIEPIEIVLRKNMGAVIELTDLESLPEAITRLIQERGKYQQALCTLREKVVYEFGRSSKKSADALKTLLHS